MHSNLRDRTLSNRKDPIDPGRDSTLRKWVISICHTLIWIALYYIDIIVRKWRPRQWRHCRKSLKLHVCSRIRTLNWRVSGPSISCYLRNYWCLKKAIKPHFILQLSTLFITYSQVPICKALSWVQRHSFDFLLMNENIIYTLNVLFVKWRKLHSIFIHR